MKRPKGIIAFTILVIICLILPAFTYAENLFDNPLDHFKNGESENHRLEVSGMYHKASEGSTYHRRRLKDDNLPRDFVIMVSGSETPAKSYLYVLLDGFSKPSSHWNLKFNGHLLAESEHTPSVGEKSIGDGKVDLERQTIFFDVTGLVEPGENTVTITDVDSPTKPYFFDGALLLNFYPSDGEHQYWIYHGVEYLEKIDFNDAVMEDYFQGVNNPETSKAKLITAYQNEEQDYDAIYFNDNPLEDSEAGYILKGNHIVVKEFDVSDILDVNNKITFTMKRYQRDEGSPYIQYTDNPIYVSLAILDVQSPPKEKIVLLANTIDLSLADDFKAYLEGQGLKVIPTSAQDFNLHKKEKYIVVLGGPDAPEGVGSIVKESRILDIDDADYVREEGRINLHSDEDVWDQDQTVWVIAGSDRSLTKQAHETYRTSIVSEIKS